MVWARAYILGLGLYEFEINGRRVGNERMTPYCNAYDNWIQYQTYDITEYVKYGRNAIGVLLGNGWAKGKFGSFGRLQVPYIDYFTLLCEMRICYEDGSVDTIGTDETWKCFPSPVLFDSIYDGEIYDSTKEIADWSQPGYDDSHWDKMEFFLPEGMGSVTERLSLPVGIKEVMRPLDIIHTSDGESVVDMGQNMVGWLRIRLKVAKGTKVRLLHGEILQNGKFYNENLRTAKQEFIYIAKGGEEIMEPHFSFFGFRYVKLEGFPQEICPEDIDGCVVYSDLQATGSIWTSDEKVNRLFLNALWGQKGNFLDVPTDCPQRDERMGWTGDAQVFSGTAMFNMDAYAFYVKYLQDLSVEQAESDGMVASVIPTFFKKKHKVPDSCGGGSCGWSDAATILPWVMYLYTGDKTILKRQYQSMKSYVDWIRRQDIGSGDLKLWKVGFHFGDWLALDGPVAGSVEGGTEKGFLASAYYRISSLIVAKTAEILGLREEARFYRELSEAVREAIQLEYIRNNGFSFSPTQTAYVISLQFNLLEEVQITQFAKNLEKMMRDNHMHLTTGFVGTPYLCRALSKFVNSESAYQVFFQEDYPGWFYEIQMGATTIWERWDSVLPDGTISGTGMNSLNHYSYGSIVEWMYRNMCGIRPMANEPGFKKMEIRPEFHRNLNHVKAVYMSAMGAIVSEWELREDNQALVHIVIPFNSEALVRLPGAKRSEISGIDESMKIEQTGGEIQILLNAGEYQFSYMICPLSSRQVKYLKLSADEWPHRFKCGHFSLHTISLYISQFACS